MQTVIIDLDGICFDSAARLERCKDNEGKIDWDKAFSDKEIIQDPAIPGAAKSTHIIQRRFQLLYLTGRSDKCHKITAIALQAHGFFTRATMAMRKPDDFHPDHEIKAKKIQAYQEANYEFVAAIDDDYNGKLKPFYEDLGIPCFTSFAQFFESEIWKKK